MKQNQSIYPDTQVWRENVASTSFPTGPETWRQRVSPIAEDGIRTESTSHRGLPYSIPHLLYATSIPF